MLNHQPLLDKIEQAIGAWTRQTLSYAGRLEILKTVVQGTCCYWLSIFSIPHAVIDRIETICKTFLWGAAAPKVTWPKLCKPKEEGGLGLLDLTDWNRSFLVKNLWDFHLKKDSLWIQWVSEFYLKGRTIWEWSPSLTASPFFKSIIRIRDELVESAGTTQLLIAKLKSFTELGKLNVSKVYDWIRAQAPIKPWGKLLWAPSMTPKHSFILWMATMDRLATMDRVEKRSREVVNSKCVLCGVETETKKHLFFACNMSREVWTNIRIWLGIRRRPTTLDATLKWLKKDVRGKSYRSKTQRCALASLVYHIWEARNKWKFEKIGTNPKDLTRKIQLHVYSAMFSQHPELAISRTNGQPGSLMHP
ncbi:hypothetical protein ABFS82_01G112800 [Erythranthe guttata]